MKITILTDNTPCSANPQLIAEHGLSMLIETGEQRILCDMGLSTAFYQNASTLHLDLSQIDCAFVSHGHKDHSGGLMTFLEVNQTAPVYLSPAVFHQHFFTSRHSEKKEISTDEQVLSRYNNRLRFVEGSCWLTENIAAIRCNTHQWSCPVGNIFLTAQPQGGTEHPDDFSHELSLAFKTSKGLVVISSCSHNGALNILQSCQDFTNENNISAFIGGLHFVDCRQTFHEVEEFQQEWNRLYPHALLYTGHCTSDKAKRALQTTISNLHIFHTGEEILL